jgi:serine protease inhibitor
MTVTVNAPTVPTFTQVAAICSGGSFTLPTTSTNAVTGTWSPAINNTATTTYTFTPAAGLCASNTLMTVTVNPTYSVNISQTVCPSQIPYLWNGLTFNAPGL